LDAELSELTWGPVKEMVSGRWWAPLMDQGKAPQMALGWWGPQLASTSVPRRVLMWGRVLGKGWAWVKEVLLGKGRAHASESVLA